MLGRRRSHPTQSISLRIRAPGQRESFATVVHIEAPTLLRFSSVRDLSGACDVLPSRAATNRAEPLARGTLVRLSEQRQGPGGAYSYVVKLSHADSSWYALLEDVLNRSTQPSGTVFRRGDFAQRRGSDTGVQRRAA